VDAAFCARGIPSGRNFIYSTLSALLSKKILARQDGRYFVVAAPAAVPPPSSRSASTAKKQTPKTRRKISLEGRKRIREALKWRLAAKRAAGQKAA
jgi:hypothetical protein